jgi:hypothetical protein
MSQVHVLAGANNTSARKISIALSTILSDSTFTILELKQKIQVTPYERKCTAGQHHDDTDM